MGPPAHHAKRHVWASSLAFTHTCEVCSHTMTQYVKSRAFTVLSEHGRLSLSWWKSPTLQKQHAVP